MTLHATGTGEAHPFIIPLTKIDVERRLVIGTAAEEIADKAREIMDYATAKPQFEAWSNSFSEATGGSINARLDPKPVAPHVAKLATMTAKTPKSTAKIMKDAPSGELEKGFVGAIASTAGKRIAGKAALVGAVSAAGGMGIHLHNNAAAQAAPLAPHVARLTAMRAKKVK